MSDTIPLEIANLCVDCRQIGHSFETCPHCASKALLPLAPVLDREESNDKEKAA